MKSYPSISGIKKEFKGLPCIAFDKYDGSCIRIEYSKKKGFYKFGTRRRLLDKTDKEFGMAIDLFLNKYGESIPKVLTDNKELKNAESVVFFAEFYGEDSFAGYHNYDKPFDIILFDVAPCQLPLPQGEGLGICQTNVLTNRLEEV